MEYFGLKHKEDLLPITIALLTFAADILIIATYKPTIFWTLLLFALSFVLLRTKGFTAAYNHHYQHNEAFEGMPMNHLLHSVLAVHTFVPYGLWVYQHNLDHHANTIPAAPFPQDAAGWMKKDGTQMSVLEFTLKISCYAHYAAFKNLIKLKSHFRQYGYHILFGHFLYLTFLLSGLYFNPIPTFVLWFLLPLVIFVATAHATYIHHSGLYEDSSQALGARNEISPEYNFISGNLGYHSAHHDTCNLHWTEYPRMHIMLYKDGEVLDERHRYYVAKYSWFDKIILKMFYNPKADTNIERHAAFSVHSEEIKSLYKREVT